MARIRSPGYPSFALEQVVEFAAKVHHQDRQHPVDRETAARHMGFSGLSGTSDRALSATLHFGLMEKVQKGEMRVTDRTLHIIHPVSPSERTVALHEAGFAPDLFKELRDRYPGAPPSKDSLSSYLLRSGFASAAIPTATKAYLETCYYLQRQSAYESDGTEDPIESESIQEPPLEPIMSPAPAPIERSLMGAQIQASHVTPVAYASGPVPALNRINMNVKGAQVHLEALLDRKGIAALKRKLTSLEALLDDEAEEHDAPDEEDLDPRD